MRGRCCWILFAGGGTVRREAVERLLRRQEEGGVNFGMRIWALLNFALWHRHWIERRAI